MRPGEYIAVDLDGTLAEIPKNASWWPPDVIGKPIPKMVKRVKQWIAEGKEVRILTARVDGGVCASMFDCPSHIAELYKDVEYVKTCINHWCLKHIGQILPITNIKDCGMVELWDDRAIQMIPNTGETLAELAAELHRDIGWIRR